MFWEFTWDPLSTLKTALLPPLPSVEDATAVFLPLQPASISPAPGLTALRAQRSSCLGCSSGTARGRGVLLWWAHAEAVWLLSRW